MGAPEGAATLAFVLGFLLTVGAAHAQPGTALSGNVRSSAEGAMEGVLVSAHRDGSSITVTVVSDADGHYAFPAARLVPGPYTLTDRKSTRLNSSHVRISYAVFCLKNKR